MRPIRGSKISTAKWVGAGRGKSELVGEGSVFASLTWTKSWGSLATAETHDGSWTFKRAGFLHPMITVRRPGSDANIGIVEMSWSGAGDAKLAGHSFRIQPTSFWHTEWTATDAGRSKLFSLKTRFTLKDQVADVVFEPVELSTGLVELLSALAWYIVLLSAREYDANSVSIAAMVATGTT